MIAAIIQARMGSSRLPEKVMADIIGQPMLARILARLSICKKIDNLAVATSQLEQDQVIADFCAEAEIFCFQGSTLDLLDRYYQTAELLNADHIVRITADCPLLDPELVDLIIHKYLACPELDYASNTIIPTWPDGLDVEIFSFSALAQAWELAELPYEREHVTPFLKTGKNKEQKKFNNLNITCRQGDFSNYRWTVDTFADLEFIRKLYKYIPPLAGFSEICEIMKQTPELMNELSLSKKQIRDQGFYISIFEQSEIKGVNMNFSKSHELKAKSEKLIPSGSQTFSKSPDQFIQPVSPVFIERGENSYVWDADDNKFIDYILALGPIILGYNHPVVTEAVTAQVQSGSIFSLPHRLEVEVAELLTHLIPCAEMVRFGKNGSDATAGAVRLARAYTGREIIACCGYHGWQDWYIGSTTRNLGVPGPVCDLIKPFTYNQISSLEEIFSKYPDQVAAVIMEPVSTIQPEKGFLKKIKQLCKDNKALLIFDEVITGFRLANGGAQEYFEVTPDLATYGKAMANGFPLSAIVGPRDLMKLFDDIFYSFTFGGEAVSLAAAKATIQFFLDNPVIKKLWSQGRKIHDGFNTISEKAGLLSSIKSQGLPPRTVINFSHPDIDPLILRSLLQQEVIQRGVLAAGYHNICYTLSDADINYTLEVYASAMKTVKKAIDSGNPRSFLKGDPVKNVFRKI
jgi:glutamate-1-semialdehyde aminotransferase/spore coat polysaccharide biosynthesis protein SpsF (cytidylyltransferase family)